MPLDPVRAVARIRGRDPPAAQPDRSGDLSRQDDPRRRPAPRHPHPQAVARVRSASILIAARGLRGFGDGFTALLLPVYLSLLGFSAFRVGLLTTATLAG